MLLNLKKEYNLIESLQNSNKENQYNLKKFVENVFHLIDKDNIQTNNVDKNNLLLHDIIQICKDLLGKNMKLTSSILQDECVKKGMPNHTIRTLGGYKKILSLFK